MSTELESLVRPFQSRDVTPAQTYYSSGQIGQPNVILRLGRSGGGKVLNGSYSNTVSYYCKAYEIENKESVKEQPPSESPAPGGNPDVSKTGGSLPPPKPT